MKRILTSLFIVLLISLISYISIEGLQPSATYFKEEAEKSFSTANAFNHVKRIGSQPHSIGTKTHSKVRNYIVQQLQDLDLEVQTQKGYDFNNSGILTAPQNILAKIEGNDPSRSALLVMTHYDSAVHSSPGASDAASGVGVILESLRVFLQNNPQPKNDIIICFTDGEEVGLSGAGLFVKEHTWAKNIGLVLNFEARGSGGPSNTILETNTGNTNLINAFAEANPQFPVATSLMYSVYKKLPNDTDATVFREVNDTPSFFFAFIDDHFDYHTAKDTPENLDIESLVHQATYLQALIPYFSQVDLDSLKADKDQVFFNFFGLDIVHYPFSFIYPMLVFAWVIFLGLFVYGMRHKILDFKQIGKGFWDFSRALFFGILISATLSDKLPVIYDSILENQNDFPFNGHLYIGVGVSLTLAILFYFYRNYSATTTEKNKNAFVAPLVIWLVLLSIIAFILKGAAYFIIPFFFSLLSFGLLLFNKRNPYLHLLLGVPALIILVPLVQFFPVGLGLSKLFISALFVMLIFGLLWSVMAYLKYKKAGVLIFAALAGFLFLTAHSQSGYTEDRPKPNSLIYMLDVDQKQATWNTYDKTLDAYTKPYFKKDDSNVDSVIFDSKYNAHYTYTSVALLVNISATAIQVEKNILDNTFTEYNVKISPQREVKRIEVFLDKNVKVESLTANEKATPNHQLPYYKNRKTPKLLTYFAVDQDTLRLKLKLKTTEISPVLEVYDASYDLLENETLNIAPRDEKTMPRPFVLNDVMMTKQKVILE